MNKKKKALVALVLIAVFLCGIVAGYFLKPTTITVTVEEAISVTPENVPVSVCPNETVDAAFTIANVASNPISLLIDVHLIEENATFAGFFTLTYETPFSAQPGSNAYTVSIYANASTAPGTYIFEVTWER